MDAPDRCSVIAQDAGDDDHSSSHTDGDRQTSALTPLKANPHPRYPIFTLFHFRYRPDLAQGGSNPRDFRPAILPACIVDMSPPAPCPSLPARHCPPVPPIVSRSHRSHLVLGRSKTVTSRVNSRDGWHDCWDPHHHCGVPIIPTRRCDPPHRRRGLCSVLGSKRLRTPDGI